MTTMDIRAEKAITAYTFLYTIDNTALKFLGDEERSYFHITILTEPDARPFEMHYNGCNWVPCDQICGKGRSLLGEISKAANLFGRKAS